MDLNLCIQWDLRPAYGNFESVPQWLQYFIAAGSLKKYWTELSDLLLKGENVSLNLSKTQNKKGSDMLMEHLYHVKHYNQHTQLFLVFCDMLFQNLRLDQAAGFHHALSMMGALLHLL